MKKIIIALLLCIVSNMCLISCDKTAKNTTDYNGNTSTIVVNVEQENVDSTSIINGDFASEVFSLETVDEFGDKTGNTKIGFICCGKFSNTATTNSPANLVIGAYPKDKKIYFTLFEYARNHPSDDVYSIVFENENGETLKINELNYSQNYSKFYKFIENSKDVKIRMTEICEYSTPTTATFRIFNPHEYVKLITQYESNN